MQNSVAKKLFAVGVSAATVLMGLAPFAASAAPHTAGTNVSSSDGTVWMITQSNTRRAYTSAGAFLSYGFNSWSQVVQANSDDLALPVDSAGFIPPQDGSIICSNKGSDTGTCYEISGAMKYGFTSASVFTGLGFSFTNALSGDVSFMNPGSMLINSTTQPHLPGTLVNNNGTVYLVGTTGLLGIPDLNTFNSWGYSFSKVVPANAADKAMTQTGVMAMRVMGQLSPTALTGNPGNPGTPNPPVVNGSVSASLASDTPAANTLVAGQVGGDLAHFMFSGTGTVTQVVINRIGVSADTSVNNVYLYQGNNRITDAGSLSNGVVTFGNTNGLFTVNGSATISVRVDIASGISGQTIGAQLASFAVANGTPMTSSVSGNLFQIANVSNLATAKLSFDTGSNAITSDGASNGTAGTINAGTMNARLWSANITTSQRNVLLKYVAFKQIGSISQDSIQNLKLVVDGNPVGNTASISNYGSNTNVVLFDLTGSPYTLPTGSHTIELHGDVVKGSSYNYDFTLQTATDIVFYDTSYNVNVPLTYSGGSQISQLAPGVTTVSSGTISVQQDPAFTATQFVKNSSNITLGQWSMKAYGEDVKVQTMQVKLTYTGVPTTAEGFNNLSLFVNGGGVGSSQSALSASSTCGSTLTCTYTFGTTNLFTVPAGTTVTLAVKGDSTLLSNTNVSAVETDLNVTANSLQGVTSYSLSPSVATPYTGVTLTTGSGTPTFTKNSAYTNQSVGSNLTKVKIGSYTIQASSVDGVRVNSLTVAMGGSVSSTTTLANLYLVTPQGSTNPVNVSASNTFSVNFTVAANQTATVDVFADISNTSGTVVTTLNGTGNGASSNSSVTLSPVTGQTITVGSGSITSANITLQTSSPVPQFVIAGSQNVPAATFNFVATSGSAQITQLDFFIATSSGATTIPVTSITVGGITSTVVPGTGAAAGATSTISGLTLNVGTALSGVDVPVTMNLASVGTNGVPSNQVFTVKLGHVKYISGGVTTDRYLSVSSNSFNLVGSAPTVAISASSQKLTAGTVMIGKVTVTANAAGNITLDQIPVSIVTSGGASVTAAANNFVVIDDATGQTASTSNASFGVPAGTTASTTIYISGTYASISAGQSRTYDIELPITGTLGNSGNSAVSLQLGPAAYLKFKDVNAGLDQIPGNDGTNTYIVSYPTTQVTVTN